MTLAITSLRVDERVTPEGNMWIQDVPYLIVNACFKIEDDEHLFERTRAECEDYRSVLTVDDPKKYEEWLLRQDFSFGEKYEGYGRAWTHNDVCFQHIEKYNTFWFREWIADSTVTRSILTELEYYKEHGKLPSVYRHAEEYIVMSHFQCLERYWD